jgi:hypothetical protein
LAAKKAGRKDGARRDRTDAASLATRERHAEWIELRRKGYTYDAIAAQFKVAKSTVHEAISTHLRATVAEPAAELRQLELERLDGLVLERQLEVERLETLVQKALARVEAPKTREKTVICNDCGASNTIEGPDDELRAIEVALAVSGQKLKAVDAAIPIGASRAKLLGLNAPTKVQDVTPPRDDMWARVKDWLLNPSPELEKVLAETGWERKTA